MKPDLEDFEDLNDEMDAPRGRAMSWVVLGLAVVGFASLAYYAYHSGNQAAKDGEMLMVTADESPIKTAPANPGGEEFPNKDKTIYDVIAPQNGDKQVEKLLPEPQNPVMPGNNADHEDDDVDGVAAAPAPAPAPLPAPVAAAPAPAAAPATETTTYVNKKLVPVGEDPAALQKAPAAPAPAKAVGEPNFVNEKPAAVKAEKPAAKPAPKPAAKPASAGGSYQVQLGAYKSEAEAQAAWKKISSAHAGVLAGAPSIVKADVNGSTFYRLRAGSYANAAEAKAACAKLGGQACFPAK